MEATAVAVMGEVPYNQDRFQRARQWIAEHAGRAIRLAAQHAWFFWFPSNRGFAGYLSNACATSRCIR